MNLYIPNHPSKITLKQFCDFHEAKTDLQRVKVITGRPEKSIGNLKTETVDLIIHTFKASAVQPGPLTHQIKISLGFKSKRLGFIPDLSSMSLSEYAELDEYRSVIWGTKASYKHLPLFMATLYRPITERWGEFYKIKPYDSDDIRFYMPFIEQLPMDIVNAAILFFSTLQDKLQENSLGYLVTEARKKVETILA